MKSIWMFMMLLLITNLWIQSAEGSPRNIKTTTAKVTTAKTKTTTTKTTTKTTTNKSIIASTTAKPKSKTTKSTVTTTATNRKAAAIKTTTSNPNIVQSVNNNIYNKSNTDQTQKAEKDSMLVAAPSENSATFGNQTSSSDLKQQQVMIFVMPDQKANHNRGVGSSGIKAGRNQSFIMNNEKGRKGMTHDSESNESSDYLEPSPNDLDCSETNNQQIICRTSIQKLPKLPRRPNLYINTPIECENPSDYEILLNQGSLSDLKRLRKLKRQQAQQEKQQQQIQQQLQIELQQQRLKLQHQEQLQFPQQPQKKFQLQTQKQILSQSQSPSQSHTQSQTQIQSTLPTQSQSQLLPEPQPQIPSPVLTRRQIQQRLPKLPTAEPRIQLAELRPQQDQQPRPVQTQHQYGQARPHPTRSQTKLRPLQQIRPQVQTISQTSSLPRLRDGNSPIFRIQQIQPQQQQQKQDNNVPSEFHNILDLCKKTLFDQNYVTSSNTLNTPTILPKQNFVSSHNQQTLHSGTFAPNNALQKHDFKNQNNILAFINDQQDNNGNTGNIYKNQNIQTYSPLQNQPVHTIIQNHSGGENTFQNLNQYVIPFENPFSMSHEIIYSDSDYDSIEKSLLSIDETAYHNHCHSNDAPVKIHYLNIPRNSFT